MKRDSIVNNEKNSFIGTIGNFFNTLISNKKEDSNLIKSLLNINLKQEDIDRLKSIPKIKDEYIVSLNAESKILIELYKFITNSASEKIDDMDVMLDSLLVFTDNFRIFIDACSDYNLKIDSDDEGETNENESIRNIFNKYSIFDEEYTNFIKLTTEVHGKYYGSYLKILEFVLEIERLTELKMNYLKRILSLKNAKHLMLTLLIYEKGLDSGKYNLIKEEYNELIKDEEINLLLFDENFRKDFIEFRNNIRNYNSGCLSRFITEYYDILKGHTLKIKNLKEKLNSRN